MQLKKLILHGFKSFADRTEFAFDSAITGIVGPNGCGKSNVVDGFKWVLGEQSAKSLRGEAMLDVIFNGSGNRKPAGMAEVVLVFANPKGGDGRRALALDVDEVAVGRRLFRDGSSEYQLNNQAARLKDIRELFFDTGIGVDAYSVIEQGRIAALLEANPEERRLIFEEAAGISKFKQRKKEAQRKLEKVDQNLLRVHDIVEEVEKRLRSVKIQAGRARTFQEHSQRLSELRLTYALQEYHSHHQQLAELDKGREDAQFRLEDLFGDLSRKQNELAQTREKFEGLSQRLQHTEYELVGAQAAMQSTQQRQHYAQQQLQQIAEQLGQFAQDRQSLAAKAQEAGQSLEQETGSLARLSAELDAQAKLIAQRQAAYRDAQLQLNRLNNEIEQHKSTIVELMRRQAHANSAMGAIDIERKNIVAQQARLGERRNVVAAEIDALESLRGELQTRLAATQALLRDLQKNLEEQRSEAALLGERLANLSDALGSAKEHRSGLISRQKLLEDLEAKREGVSEGVQSVLKQRGEMYPYVRGLVADVLRVDVEHAPVIEAALDGRDQWLLVDDSSAALAGAAGLEELEGRVNFLCVDRLERSAQNSGPRTARLPQQIDGPSQPQEEPGGPPPAEADLEPCQDAYDWNQHPQPIRLALDLVRFEPENAAIARHLLGRTIFVEDLAAAMELHAHGPRGYRYVTAAGQVVEADGVLRAGPLTAAMGLLSRHAELEAIHFQIAEVDSRIAALSADLSSGNAQAKMLQENQNALRNAFYDANTTQVQLTSALAQNQDRHSTLQREHVVLQRELQGFLDQMAALAASDQKLAQEKQRLEADLAQAQQEVEKQILSQQQTAEQLRQGGEELTSARVLLGQVQEKQLAAQQSVQRLRAAVGELAQQMQRVEQSVKGLDARQASVEQELEQARAEQAALAQKQEALAQQVAAMQTQVKEAGQATEQLSARVDALRNEHAQMEQALHALQLRAGEARVRLETLVARTSEELQLDLPGQYAALSADGKPGYQPGQTDWDAIAAQIKELREKIQRLGNVNLDSLGELAELEQRQNFLTTQVADLTGSKQQLEQLIEEINVESGLRFEQTFNAVREHFQGMFRKLFGGGKADIYLQTEVDDASDQPPQIGPDGQTVLPVTRKIDPLDAGIEIMAHPPGKKPVNITQLSGGEKTMTCVALLLSIFKSKPSPFCILDEVDAALDEANNQRFNLIVQEFLEQSQFIIITHSKRTMQIVDVLYGVTMQEQGVSKRVAVKFDQVDNQGRIKENAYAAA